MGYWGLSGEGVKLTLYPRDDVPFDHVHCDRHGHRPGGYDELPDGAHVTLPRYRLEAAGMHLQENKREMYAITLFSPILCCNLLEVRVGGGGRRGGG